MSNKSPYTQALEDCIKNELLPVYNLYFKQNNTPAPALSIEHLLVTKTQIAALFKPPGVLAFTPDRRVTKKQKNSP